MAVLEDGVTAGQLLGIDATFKAARVSIRPSEVLGWQSIASRSGALTGLASNVPIFSLRNASANLLLVRRVGVGFICTTAFTTAQLMEYSLFVSRAWTTSDSGGIAIALTGNTNKHRTSLATVSNIDARVSTTGTLTAGAKTFDTNIIGVTGAWIGAVGAALNPALNNLLAHDAGDYPLVLAQNEGINIHSLQGMGAAGVGTAYISLEFAEATSY